MLAVVVVVVAVKDDDDVVVVVVFVTFPLEISMFVLFSLDNVVVLVGPLVAVSYLRFEDACWEFVVLLLFDDEVDGVKSLSLTSLLLLLLLLLLDSSCC